MVIWRENNFEDAFDFGTQPPALNKVVLSYADNLGGYVFPPTEVEVWGGNNVQDLKVLNSIKVDRTPDYFAVIIPFAILGKISP